MPLSWNEIRQNAIAFSRDWIDETRESAEAQTFWNDFFQVFGVRRRTVASFEEPVRNLGGDCDFIDLFWPGTLLAEHKSRGRSLAKAESQAMRYIRALVDDDRRQEVPRYIVVSDFARVILLPGCRCDRSSVLCPAERTMTWIRPTGIQLILRIGRRVSASCRNRLFARHMMSPSCGTGPPQVSH